MLLQFRAMTNKTTSEKQLIEIATLKNQYWKYTIDSQIRWIAEHYEDNDIHILAYQESILIAYAGLVFNECIIDGIQSKFCGLGNVCVSAAEQKKGVGKLLVEEANKIINLKNSEGFLFCHKSLVPFYQKCGWNVLTTNSVLIEGNNYVEYLLNYNSMRKVATFIEFKRNF